ncbi:MAG: hypothetical protein GC206_12895 [Alphaproteobacteria bacterium]|nr:hypothetical protein [Alphaproteobacteria bacterium]
MSPARDLAALLAATTLAGCIILPAGDEGVSDQAIVSIVLGETTRAETEARLGSPLFEWRTARVLVYAGGAEAHLFWIAAGPGAIAAGDVALGDHVVLIEYDEDGRIVRIGRAPRPAIAAGYREIIESWRADPLAEPTP